jgi:lipopolysaccharide export system permease protein
VSTIDRYFFRTVARSSLVMLLVLLALSGFINLVDQLEDVGVGRFQTVDAVFMVLFQWPRHGFDLFPMAVLLGAMFGLGGLAGHSELIAVRAIGVSLARLSWATLLTGIVLAILAAVIGEFVVPPAERFAQTYKSELLEDKTTVSRLAGAWFRDGNRIVNILQIEDQAQLAGVYTYQFEPDGSLLEVGRAASAELTGDSTLKLQDYRVTRVDDEVASAQQIGHLEISTELAGDLLESSVVPPESMDAASLLEYVDYLKSNDLQSVRYELAFWSRMANIAAVALMALLALPFVFGTLRSGGQGVRLLAGVLIGVVFFLAGGALADSATVYGLSPIVAAWIPAMLLLVAAMVGLARVR